MNTLELTLHVAAKHESILQKTRRIRVLAKRERDLLARREDAPGQTSENANDDAFYRASTTWGPDPEAGSASKSKEPISRSLSNLNANMWPPGEAALGQPRPGTDKQTDGTAAIEDKGKLKRKRTFWELFVGFC